MRYRRSYAFVLLFACAALLGAAGCWRADTGGQLVAEVDDPGYRRAKEWIKQGRNQEALIELDKVIARRSTNPSPETHLEMAILYHQHLRDPLSAIYHYKKYLAQAPAKTRDNLVNQQIEAAKREYLATLPGRPSLEAAGGAQEYLDVINRLREQNEKLRSSLLEAQRMAGQAMRAQASVVAVENPIVVASPGAQSGPAAAQPARQQQQPARTVQVAPPPPQAAPARAQQQQQPAQPQAASGRRHVVRQGDNLYNISRQYYGSGLNAQVEAIVNANRDQLQSRDTPLRPGMVLRVP